MKAECLDIISVIVDSLASIGAIVAIGIGIRANGLAKKANEATNDELKQTVKLHNQSINIDLLDKRCELIQEIEKIDCPIFALQKVPKMPEYKEPNISKIHISILFEDDCEILKFYNLLLEDVKKILIDIGEIIEFHDINGEFVGGIYENKVWDEILNYENMLSFPNATIEDENDFEQYCENNVATKYINELDLTERYNYYIIRCRYLENISNFETHKKKILFLMEKYIKRSLI